MKNYVVTIQIKTEDRGINGSWPDPRIIREYVLEKLPLGKIDGHPLKVKQVEVLAIGEIRN